MVAKIWQRRKPAEPRYCEQCHRETPHVRLVEGVEGSPGFTRITLRCQECDYGNELEYGSEDLR